MSKQDLRYQIQRRFNLNPSEGKYVFLLLDTHNVGNSPRSEYAVLDVAKSNSPIAHERIRRRQAYLNSATLGSI